MTTTPEQKNAILLDAKNLVRMAIAGQRPFLSNEDYEELESDCLMAASRAIDDFEPDRGCRLSSLMFRYIVQKRIKVLKHRMRKHNAVNDTDELCDGYEPYEHGVSPEHVRLVQDMEIIIDRAGNDGVISDLEHRMLTSRRLGSSYREIGRDETYSPAGVKRILDTAVAKIRLAYRTAE